MHDRQGGVTAGQKRRVGIGYRSEKWMISLCLLCLWVLSGSPATAQEPAPQGEVALSLEEAVHLALENNPGYLSALTGQEVAAHQRDAAARQRYPRVDAVGSYRFAPIEERRIIPGALLEDLEILEDKFDSQIGTVGVLGTVPLYTGGRITAEIGAAEHLVQAASTGAEDARARLALLVAQVYYGVLVLERIRRADDAAVRNLEESARVVKQFLEVERVPRVDLLRVESRLSLIRQELIRTESALEKTRDRLRRVLGLDEMDKRGLKPTGTLDFEPLSTVDPSEYLSQALERRPDYQSLEAQVAAQAENILVARSGNLPQVHLEAGYLGAAGTIDGTGVQDDAAVMLTLSQKLFDGGVIAAQIARERAKHRQLQQQLADLRLQIRFQVEAALEDLDEAAARVRNTEATVAAANEALRVEQLRVETAKGIINDLLDAQTDALAAEVEHAVALADHRVARENLSFVTGIVPVIQQRVP